jgi:hypothetical protein
MVIAERPYSHLSYCVNEACEHYGEFYQIPSFEVKAGKAVRQ